MQRTSSLARFLAWCSGFILTLVLFQWAASLRAPSVAWIAITLVLSGVVGAAFSFVIERLVASMQRRGRLHAA